MHQIPATPAEVLFSLDFQEFYLFIASLIYNSLGSKADFKPNRNRVDQPVSLEYSTAKRKAMLCAHHLNRIFLILIFLTNGVNGQFTVVGKRSVTGTVSSISGNTLTVMTEDGETSFQFTKAGDSATPLLNSKTNLRHQTTIQLSGKVSLAHISPGQFVEFSAKLSKPGRSQGEVTHFRLLDTIDPVITANREPENSRDFVQCKIIARVESIRKNTVSLSLPKQPFAPQGKLRIRATENATLSISETSLARCKPGDIVKSLAAIELNTGDLVIEKVVILLDRKEAQNTDRKKTVDPLAMENYLKYSDQPGLARDLRSQHFLLHTDLSDRSAKMLLDKLESMIGLISQYYRQLPKGIIECYVVRDLANWNNVPLDPKGVAKIRERAGVTLSRGALGKVKSIVYACADPGVVQHEAVHAYCSQAFGSTGPTWYSEGMAEMGQYWKKGNLAVDVSPPVVHYLTQSKPKNLLEIVAAGQITGDSWQAYAWRWALCHLLANNSNFSPRFKGLGINMMSGGKATFESVYGDVAQEISFEYAQFFRNLGNGYRVDLCQWDWTSKPNAISGSRRVNCRIDSAKGWQASKLKLNQGKKYEFVCVGEWSTSQSAATCDGNGDPEGKGKLIGVIFANYQLSEVIELGQKGEFIAKQDGHLFLRCRDAFTQIADNKGVITVHFRRAQ
ncbi:MAG: hypothetical protein VX438_04320 [Planctomycetota bacterium]|nr:hypothetical protein [Planctomycetota bacterium]